MSQTAHIPSHRKPRARSRKNLALRAGVAGGVLGTIAVTTGAASASSGDHSAGEKSSPAETTAEMPALSADLPETAQRTADSLAMSALQYELDEARDTAAGKAAEKAKEAKAKAEREAQEARRAAAAEKAEERASRASERTTLSAAEAPDTASAPSTATGSAAEVISFLRAQLGKAYVSGATGPSAYDCSGLTQAAFKQVGIDLPRVSQDQSTTGTPISVSEAQPGDLLFWGGTGSAYHVAVYVGNDQYIDAANPSKGVVQQALSDYPPTSATRVL
ncbi:NlpC/P60 family protein [Streptomyces armeniacus]|uniref:NlpC/P60 family protein n=1 Tax=Streptomyces armeniacus TaxID=83291 RepID=A0A345XN38_9ACTN|nr:C40 family peptidase [Streptomyces armeniacus]AXK33054.1 NlpC/P60 family protein [Streptomyces armeniacus]